MTYQTIFFIGLCVLKSFLSVGQEEQTKTNANLTPIVLFICEHGAGMSPIATAYFNKIAKENGLNAQAIFRGISINSALGIPIQKGLLNDNFNINGWKPKPISKYDTENAYQVVTLNCALPDQYSTNKPTIRWNNIPISEGYVRARDDLERRVRELVAILMKEKVD